MGSFIYTVIFIIFASLVNWSPPSPPHSFSREEAMKSCLETWKNNLVKNKQNPPPESKKEPEVTKTPSPITKAPSPITKAPAPITKAPAPAIDNNIESELRVVNFKEYQETSTASSSRYSPVTPYESWPLPQQQRAQTTIAAPAAMLYEPKPLTTVKPPAMLTESRSLVGKREDVPLKPRPSQKNSSQKQMSKPVIVAPMLVQEYGPQPLQTYSSRDQRAQSKDQIPEQRSKYESPDQTEEQINSYHAVLMSPSKQKFHTLRMSQSVLGPTSKNYMRDNSLFFADREAVLVLGGIDPHTPYGTGRNAGKDVFRFQPDSNSWELVGDLPEPRHHHSVAFLKGRVFLAGGADPRDDDVRGKSVVVSTVWSFEPVSRAWFSETGMLTPRKNFGLVVSNGKLYAIGGQDRRGKVLSSVESFDPNIGLWKEVAPTKIARTGMACAKFRDMIWVAGGMTDSLETPLTPTVECYDTRRNVWTFGTPLRFPRCFGRFFAMNDILYLIGGAGRISQKAHSTASISGIDVWDPNSKTWKPKAELVIPRHGHSLAYLGSQILIIGGVTTAYMRALNNVECYCCKRETWIRGVNPLPITLSGQGSITLPPASLL